MGVSGGITTIVQQAPTTFYFRAPILPMITVISPATVSITWPAPFADSTYMWHLDDEDIQGKATAALTTKTAAGMVFTVSAPITISLGARLFVAAWA